MSRFGRPNFSSVWLNSLTLHGQYGWMEAKCLVVGERMTSMAVMNKMGLYSLDQIQLLSQDNFVPQRSVQSTQRSVNQRQNDLPIRVDEIWNTKCEDCNICKVSRAPSKLVFNVFSSSGHLFDVFIWFDGEVTRKSFLLMLRRKSSHQSL